MRISLKYYLFSIKIAFTYEAVMQVSIRALRYIVATADCGNISEAARRLNVSQPSVSAAVAEFEAAVGVTVFLRHHARGVSLTPAGQRLVNEARALIKHAEDFARNAQAIGGSLQGEIHVGCFVTLAPRYMPLLLAEFGRSYPGISVRIDDGDQEHVLGALTTGRTELALTYELAVPAEIASQALVELPPHAVLPAGHALAREQAVGLKQLAREPFVLLDLPLSREYFLGMFRAHGVEPRIAWRSRSYEFVRGLVAGGHGFAILNVLPQTRMTYDGSEVAIRPILEPLPPVRVVCLSLPELSMRPAVKAFADFLQSAFRVNDAGAPLKGCRSPD